MQYPYLSGGDKGKLTVIAKVFLDPERTGSRGGYNRDKVSLRVAVAKKKFSKVNRPRSVELLTSNALLARTHKTRKVNGPGVMTLQPYRVTSHCAHNSTALVSLPSKPTNMLSLLTEPQPNTIPSL